MIKKILKENLKPFFLSTVVSGSLVLGYFQTKANQNLKEYEKKLYDENARDQTRSTNEFYGLNWGFAADNLIKDKIDSGDIIFFKYNCQECLSITDMAKCYVKQLKNQDQEYDGIGVTFREQDNVFVMTKRFEQPIIQEYSEFISSPYFEELSIRKLKFKKNDLQHVKLFLKVLADMKQNFHKSYVNDSNLSDSQIVYDYLNRSQILKHDQFKIQDIDCRNPICFDENYSLDSKIIVRSISNNDIYAK